MKKIFLTTILGLSAMFAGTPAETHVGGLETNTTLIILEGQDAKNLSKQIKKFIKESDAEKVLKQRLESAARIEDAQRAMKRKHPTPTTTYKGVSKAEIDASLVAQAKRVRDESVSYMAKTYGDIDCSKVKPFEAYNKAICKAMNENVVDAIEDLKKLDKVDNRAFCVRQMVNLQLADKDNDVISRVTKNIVLSKLYKKPLTGTCTKVFNIVSKK